MTVQVGSDEQSAYCWVCLAVKNEVGFIGWLSVFKSLASPPVPLLDGPFGVGSDQKTDSILLSVAAEVSSTVVLDRPASDSSCQSKTNVRILILNVNKSDWSEWRTCCCADLTALTSSWDGGHRRQQNGQPNTQELLNDIQKTINSQSGKNKFAFVY
jgi:hypothetical protein